jgi:hypothetical protein
MRSLDGDWHSVQCNASAWALCASDTGSVLPQFSPRAPERIETVVADGWNSMGCTNSQGKTLISAGVYDISACDVLDEGLDLLYTQGMLYHRHDSLTAWEYWILILLAIVLVRFLSYNLRALWDPETAIAHHQKPALFCCCAAVIVCLLRWDTHFVSSADQVFFWANVGYIGFYLGVHLKNPATQPVYNILVGSLQLIACRLYTAAETPYNLVLLGILATRGWYARHAPPKQGQALTPLPLSLQD